MGDIHNLISKTKNLKLLYVEDDEIVKISTVSILEGFFGDVLVCTNGQDGVDIFNTTEVDIIITDLNMPIMGGIDMIKIIREKNNKIPIYVFSAFNEESIINEVKKYNIQGYLNKPMNFEQFISELLKGVSENISRC